MSRLRAVALAVVSALGLTLAVAPASSAAPTSPAATGSELDAQQALALARSTGQRVEATALRTETEQVFASPDGNLTQEQFLEPVRVRQGTAWVPVDLTLHARPDGTVAPAASAFDVAFSGGGDVALARLRRDGTELTLRWPGALPVPGLSGDTATYAEVLPGVDLIVRAGSSGFSQLLVVKSRAAAQNPALTRLRFPTGTTGLSVRAAADGTLAATDASGAAVFEAPAPYMWDSSGGALPPGIIAPAPGGMVRPAGVRFESGELSIVPDQDVLLGAQTVYPVYIDPVWSGGRQAWTQVWSNYPTTSFYNGANLNGSENVARVGYDATDGKQTRSFFQFNTASVRGKHIMSAILQTFEVWSRSCTAREVQLWKTGPISTSTTWSKQPAWNGMLTAKNVAKGYSSSCPAGGVEFDVTDHVRDAAKAGASSITEGLRATPAAESNHDTNSWKKFRNNPSITIVYNTVPSVPRSLTTDGSATCTTGSGRLAIGTGTPTLRATVSDADNAVRARFQWWAGSVQAGEYLSPSVAGKTPTVVAKQIPAGAFGNGAIAKWRVRAEDGTDASAWSPWCEFLVDTSRPPIPTVTSTGFPDNGEGNAVMGVALPVTFGANGGTDVASYEYSVNGASSALDRKATPSAPGGSITVSVLPDRFVNWLYMRSVDRSGNRSHVATVIFYAADPPAPYGDWPLDEAGDGGYAEDLVPPLSPATLAGGASWTEGLNGGALHLDGSTGYAATPGPVVNTSHSFSVSAWVRLTSKAHNAAVLTQAGTQGTSFALYYSTAYDRWVFNRFNADVASPTITRAMSTTAPALDGRWVHLAGVYDEVAKQIRLYVNGTLESQAAFTTPWQAQGAFQIGRSKLAGAYVDYWPGDIDQAKAYPRVLLPGELQQVARVDGQWKLDETSGTTAADALGRHPATWSASGVSRIAGVSGNAVDLNGTTGVLTASGPAIRTDGSYTVAAWVRPDAVTRNAIAVSQQGSAVGGFNLGYSWDPETGGYRWSVRTSTWDSTTSSVREATDPFHTPTVGAWTFLTAVYDASVHELRLYVDGQAVGVTYHGSNWTAPGSLLIGRGTVPGATAPEYWNGGIDDVRVFSGAVSDQEIWLMYQSATA